MTGRLYQQKLAKASTGAGVIGPNERMDDDADADADDQAMLCHCCCHHDHQHRRYHNDNAG